MLDIRTSEKIILDSQLSFSPLLPTMIMLFLMMKANQGSELLAGTKSTAQTHQYSMCTCTPCCSVPLQPTPLSDEANREAKRNDCCLPAI